MKFKDISIFGLTETEQEVVEGFTQIDKIRSHDTIMFVVSIIFNAIVFCSGLPTGMVALFLIINMIAFYKCLNMNKKERLEIEVHILEIADKEIKGDADINEKVKLLLGRITDKIEKGVL